jgi:hypothetical protein
VPLINHLHDNWIFILVCIHELHRLLAWCQYVVVLHSDSVKVPTPTSLFFIQFCLHKSLTTCLLRCLLCFPLFPQFIKFSFLLLVAVELTHFRMCLGYAYTRSRPFLHSTSRIYKLPHGYQITGSHWALFMLA